MRSFTIEINGETRPLPYGPFTDGAGIIHSVQVLDLWTDEELAAIGVIATEGPDPVPAYVSRMQFRKGLRAAGLLANVEAAVAAAPVAIQDYYQEASHFHRNHAELNAMAAGLGMSAGQVDDLFRAMAQIT